MTDKFIKTKELEWKNEEGDIFEKKCIKENGINIYIFKLDPNKKIPLHKHVDTRYNYILKGSMSDADNEYNEGDIVTNQKGAEHFLKAGPEGCEFLLIWNDL